LALVVVAFFRVGKTTNIPSVVTVGGVLAGMLVWTASIWFEDFILPWAVCGFAANMIVLLIGIGFFQNKIIGETHSDK
jgi:low affinity Fe/Cu permease